ncbi:MAG UNVERIFIED_CONTAM: PQQ-like beta-propeller repeat protein [Rickettsiaceae bacterium]|jgi:outer membrane protein assembly factor BamB
MKKLYLFLAVGFLLSSCGGKIHNLVSFTNELRAEIPGTKIQILRNSNSASQLDFSKYQSIRLKHKASAEPIILEDKIILLSSDGFLTAYKIDDFSQVWDVNVFGKNKNIMNFEGGILYNEGKLYVANGSQVLEVINPENGRRITNKTFPDILNSSPIIHGDFIFMTTLGNQLYALNKNNLAMMWDHAGNPETLTYGSNTSYLSVDNQNRAFVAYSSGQIYLLNALNGQIIWQHDLSLTQDIQELLPVNITDQPIFDNNNVYLATSNGKFYKFDLNNGKILWERNIDDVQKTTDIGTAIFVATNGRQAAAIDKDTGKIIWVSDIPDDIHARKKVVKYVEEPVLPSNSVEPKKSRNIFKNLLVKLKIKPTVKKKK